MNDRLDRIIHVALVMLGVMTLVSFIANPLYQKGVDIGMGAIGNALSAALGAKFGLALPKEKSE